MGKKSNVNPDHYKTGGREPIGQGIIHEAQKREYKKSQIRRKRSTRKTKPGRSSGSR